MKVDLVIVTYNRASFLKQTLDNVLEYQNELNKIYVINNNSQDNTMDILREYEKKSPKIKVFNMDKNLGAGDILFLARKSGIDLDYSEIAEIRDIFAFSDRSYYNDSVSKGEKILEIFIDKQYSYQPWNVSIDEDRVYQLKTKKVNVY